MQLSRDNVKMAVQLGQLEKERGQARAEHLQLQHEIEELKAQAQDQQTLEACWSRSCRPTNDSARSWRLPRPTWRQSATVDGCPKRTCHAWADVCRHWKKCLRGCRCRRRLRLQRPRNQIRATHRIPTAYDPILPVSGYAPVRSRTLTPQGDPDGRSRSPARLGP